MDTVTTVPPRAPSRVQSALSKSRLGVGPVAFFGLAGAAPLTVAAGGATAGFAVTGLLGIPITYVATALCLAVFASGYVAMSRRVPSAGAFYTLITRGLGRPLGVVGAVWALLAYGLMAIALYGGFGYVTASYTQGRFGWTISWWGMALIAWTANAVLGVLRVQINSGVLSVLLVCEVVVALILDVVMIAHPAGGTVSFHTLDPRLLLTAGISAAFVTAIAGFMGFEATIVLSEETKDARTASRATFIALALTGVLYAFSAWAMSVSAGDGQIVQAATEQGSELMFNLAGPHLPVFMGDVGHMLFCTSLFAAALSFHNTGARYLFSLGRENVLPGALGFASPKTGAPVVGSLVQTLICAVGIMIYALGGFDPFVQMFFWLGVTAGLGVLLLMTVTCVAVIAFFWRTPDGEGVWARLIAPGLAFVALAVIAYFTVEQYNVLLGVAPDHTAVWAFPAAYAAAAVLGLGIAAGLRALRPDVYAGIGRGAEVVA